MPGRLERRTDLLRSLSLRAISAVFRAVMSCIRLM
jgi:hypothetical protein